MDNNTTAKHAVIAWMHWGPEVFARAVRENKLILLDSGATWCHWCHVMDRVTYEDKEVVALVNKKYIPVRIDRDRLPDVDAMYQQAVPLIDSRGNGWPLTVIITPEGYTLFKATFVPPRADAKYGMAMGMVELLDQLDETWRTHREHINEAATRLYTRVNEEYAKMSAQPGKLSADLLDDIYAGMKTTYDSRHGGFGSAPKFFSAPAIEFLLARGWAGDEKAQQMAAHTLESIARGGVYDQLGGGFHRYSVDERWHVPHFEKMAYDNAAILANYANAYALTGREDFARLAREIMRWVRRVMTDPAGRGFYASQDADVGGGDDGDYFTWTVDEVRAVSGEQADTILSYYDVDPQGDMHGRGGRNVLHIPKTIAQHAALTGRSEDELDDAIEKAKSKLLQRRLDRPAPAVDKTIFADLNGMMIDAYLTAYQRLGDDRARETALTALDKLLAELTDRRGVFAHYRHGGELAGIGMLPDQAWMARALVHAFELTSDPKYLDAAQILADYILADLIAEDGGLLTKPISQNTPPGHIPTVRLVQDAPTRSPSSVAAQVLIDIAYLTGEDKYSAAAVTAMESHAGAVSGSWGSLAGGYALTVNHHLNGPPSVVVVGRPGDPATAELAAYARRAYLPGGIVLSLDPNTPAQAKLLGRLGHAAGETPIAYVCTGKACLEPARTPKDLAERLKELSRLTN